MANPLESLNGKNRWLTLVFVSILLASLVGTSQLSNTASTSTGTAPQPPTGLTATAVSSSQINLSWTAPSNNGGSAITGYMIERSTNGGSTWSTIMSNTGNTGTTYSDTGLAASTTYTYRVSAINFVGTSSPSNTASATTATQTGSIIPLYLPPGTGWNTLVQAKMAYPSVPILAIINPSNGSGQTPDPVYVSGIQNLESNGISVLGYVHTNYATRNSTEIKTEITNYKNWYNVNGIFFDQMSNVSGKETYYANLTAYAKSLGLTFTVGNPGTDTLPSYIGTVDNIVIYDNALLPTIQYLDGWHTNFAKNNFSILSYGDNSLDQTYVTSASNYVGYMYFTNNTLPNPWNSVPSYFINLIAMLYNNSPPQPPTGLTATAVSSSQINLSWTAATNNRGSAITGYVIERSTDGGTTWSTIVSNTRSTGTTYSDTALYPNQAYMYRVSAINSVGTSSPSNTASATTPPLIIKQVRSGLIASDPLNNETMTQQQLQSNPGYWRYGGDAPVMNAHYNFSRDTSGLHIGVQAPANGTWAGFYAVTPNTNAALFHAVITTQTGIIPYQYYQNGLTVETSNSSINYVTCFSDTSQWGTVWAVGSVTGNAYQGTQFNLLWYDTTPNQRLTRDCTIITNGTNYLKVYLDGVKVFNSTKLNLQMPSPFNVFLGAMTSYPAQLLNGTYNNYYVTSSEYVTVNNLRSYAATVQLQDSSGNILTSSGVSSGVAMLDVGKYHLPLAGTIRVYDSNKSLVESTQNTVNIYGGDIYSGS